jgi:hypothetical protein
MSDAVKSLTGTANAVGIAAGAIRRQQAPRDLISTLIYFCSDDSNFVAGRPSASTTARCCGERRREPRGRA